MKCRQRDEHAGRKKRGVLSIVRLTHLLSILQDMEITLSCSISIYRHLFLSMSLCECISPSIQPLPQGMTDSLVIHLILSVALFALLFCCLSLPPLFSRSSSLSHHAERIHTSICPGLLSIFFSSLLQSNRRKERRTSECQRTVLSFCRGRERRTNVASLQSRFH